VQAMISPLAFAGWPPVPGRPGAVRSPPPPGRGPPVHNESSRGFVPGARSCPQGGVRAGRQRKGPGQRLRTGSRPVGHEPGPRCLLGARALSRPNPPSSRTWWACRSGLRARCWT